MARSFFTKGSMITLISDKTQKLSKLSLKSAEGLSYSVFMKLLRKKDIKVNGARVNVDVTLNAGDRVEIYYVPETVAKYSVIFVDGNILVIDKKSGYDSDAIFDSVLKEYPTACYIHRLDRNTAGLMIFALNSESEKELLYGFKNRTFDKKYRCTVNGLVEKDEEILTAYLVKDEKNSLVKIYKNHVEGSVQIKTGYKVLARGEDTTELEVTLYTGKTHQIRAHLAHIGHFIIGDGKYGVNEINKRHRATRQKLTAHSLTLKFEKNSVLYYLNGKTFTV